MTLASTSVVGLVESLSFLLEPEIPEEPMCRRCKQQLRQTIEIENDDVKIVWKCPRCKNIVEGTDGSI